MKMLIKGGRVVDPAQKINKKADILIENGKILDIQSNITVKADETILAENKIVAPGFIDMHAHLREPGREEVETVETAVRSAVKGGFTTICAMPNTNPPCDSQADVKFLFEKAKKAGKAKVLPIGTITKAREGKYLSEMRELKEAGCLALSDDGASVESAELLRRAMEYASMLDLLIISHCEDKELAGDGVMNEGYFSTMLGLAPIAAETESIIVDRDIQLAELTGARLHIAHVSSAKSVEIIRQAKKRGVNVTAEVTPHHFSLTDESIKTFDTNLKVNPPLRSKEDVKALKEALRDGTIDVIATDHAPHLDNEKEKEFNYAPFGMIGLETALPLSAQNLIDEEYLDWPGVIQKLTANPANILKYDGGSLKIGKNADVVIIDPDKEWIYDKENIQSKAANSPFIGRKMKAIAQYVICAGKIVVKNGQII
ncbi:MAG: dihydroorotase [Candidatus Omnitrophota bacterium]